MTPDLLEYPTGTSPGAWTHRSTSVSNSSAQRASTMTLPGTVLATAACASCLGLRWGRRRITTATKPHSASVMTSRKTVPLTSSSSNWSRPCMPFTQRRDFGDQVYGAGAQHVVIDAEPDVQDTADQGGVERHRHAFDQLGHHGCYRRHIAGFLRIDTTQRNDEADHGADQAQQDEAGGQMADDGDTRRQLEAEVACQRGAAAAVTTLHFGHISRRAGVDMEVEILAGIDFA